MTFDSNGLPVQADGDGGDSAQRVGWIFTAQALSEQKSLWPISFDQCIALLEVTPGTYIRNPIKWNDPKDFSRDQQISILIALGQNKRLDAVNRMIRTQDSRKFGLCQNGDIPTLGLFAAYIRSFQGTGFLSRLALCILDLELVVNSLLRGRKGLDDVGDDLNHILCLVHAATIAPTPVSWFARWLYKTFRPESYGTTQLGFKSHIYGAVAWYFRAESGGNPELASMWNMLIFQYFGA